MSPARRARAWERTFVERVAAQADIAGLAPSVVRVFAWLIVCDPPDQSVDDMRRALTLSTGAISTATSALIRIGIVERVRQPGERRYHYRLAPGGWENVARVRLAATSQIRATAEEALALAPGRHPRLSAMRDFYAFFERSLEDLLAK